MLIFYRWSKIVVKDSLFTQSDLNSSLSQIQTEIFESVFKVICSTIVYYLHSLSLCAFIP